ncbi:hypothetical protein BH09DEP1_BH09DEP1_5040 [soil metagenome]
MKRIITIILIILWLPCELFSMEKPVTKPTKAFASNLPCVSYELLSRFKHKNSISEQEFEQLSEEAEKDNSNSQYELACYYYYGLTPMKRRDLNQAEYWLLFARKNGDLRAFILLPEIAEKQEDVPKWIDYTYDAINHGFLDQYYYLAKIYLSQKKYKKAQEALEKAIKSLNDFKSVPYFKWVSELAQVELANLLKKLNNDNKKALEILIDLTTKNNIHAMFALAVANIDGSYDLTKNIESAQKLLSKIEGFGKPEKPYEDLQTYYKALQLLGNIYEKAPYKNIKKAVEYYIKAYDWQGKFQIARLIITKKIPGDVEQAKNILREAAYKDNPDLLAAYLYATMLIGEGKQESGILKLEEVDERNPENHSLVALQLGIAHHYGFGVEQNDAKAQKYFKKILNDTETGFRSVWLARGYLYLFGLGGVNKDITKGLALINDSENKIDDVYFETEQLLPVITKLRLEQIALNQKELIGAEQQKTTKKKKKKPVQPFLPIQEAEAEEDPFQTTEKEWNEYFGVDDGSYVSLIDKKNKIFVIQDPKREQQLTIKFDALPDRDFTDIAALKYHKRIFERQGHTKRKLKHSTKYNHDFAEMLDFVIQYLGEYIPFIKDGSDKKDDQLLATVIRKDLKTGKETVCKAEYAFGQKNDEVYVYHRLLRPVKVIK